MSKHISDLNEAKVARASRSIRSNPSAAARPRLAERLVELAPLARAPLVAESVAEDSDGLSRLPRDPVTGHHITSSSTGQANALVPLQAPPLPKGREPARLSPVGITPPAQYWADEFATDVRRHIGGFLIGLAIASAMGIGLYAVLT
jgi:hypothetical protein